MRRKTLPTTKNEIRICGYSRQFYWITKYRKYWKSKCRIGRVFFNSVRFSVLVATIAHIRRLLSLFQWGGGGDERTATNQQLKHTKGHNKPSIHQSIKYKPQPIEYKPQPIEYNHNQSNINHNQWVKQLILTFIDQSINQSIIRITI